MFTSPDASPASFLDTPVTAAIVTGTNDRPMPSATSTDGPTTSNPYEPCNGIRAKRAIPAALMAIPTVSIGAAPTRFVSRPANVEPITIAAVIGTNERPAWIGL